MSSGSGDRTSSWIPLTHYIPCIRSGCVRGGPLATNPVFFLRKRLNYVSSWNHIFTGKTEMAIIFSQLPKHSQLPSIHVFSHKTSAVQSLSPCWLTTRYCFGVAAVGIFFFFWPFVLSSLSMVSLCFKLTEIWVVLILEKKLRIQNGFYLQKCLETSLEQSRIIPS